MTTRCSPSVGLCSAVALAASFVLTMPASAQKAASENLVQVHPAFQAPLISQAMLLDAARAGARIVAVGDGGTVALSDDDGATFRRAKSVPVQATLTGVYFVDERRGWAVGHWGIILHTQDGGETWNVQVQDLTKDQPLYSVWFQDANTGVAVGLWSKVLRTTDGGKRWNEVKVPAPAEGVKVERNLFHLFADRRGTLFATAEAGWLLRSDDAGATWHHIKTGYSGSLWTGIALQDGTLLLGGLRGTILRSTDGGASWSNVKQPIARSVTAFTQVPAGRVYAVGLDGLWLQSGDGQTFTGQQLTSRSTLTGMISRGNSTPLLLSNAGVLVAPKPGGP